MKSLRILLILIEPPLPFGNAASRWFYVLYKELLRRNHKVTVLVASGVESDIEKAKKEFSSDKQMHIFPFDKSRGLLGKIKTWIYPQKIHFSRDFFLALKKINPDTFDILHIEQTWAGWSGLHWVEKSLINVHHLQTIDLEFVKTRSWKQWLIYRSWFRAEKYLLSKYPYVRSCSPRLIPFIQKWGRKKKISFIPVGIDSSLYDFIPTEKRSSDKKIISVIGNMGWYPSYSATQRLLDHIWPQVQKTIPQAQLRIVGWGAKSAFGSWHGKYGVEVYENVPDIRPFFEQTTVMVYAPDRGSGMKIKILESLAFGVPVVTTSEGVEGLLVQDMVDVGLSETNEGLVERTIQVLQSFDLQEKLRHNGRKLVETQCSPQKTVDDVENMYATILENSI